jgi:hypothetical protein
MSLEGEERAAHHLAPSGAQGLKGRAATWPTAPSPDPQAGFTRYQLSGGCGYWSYQNGTHLSQMGPSLSHSGPDDGWPRAPDSITPNITSDADLSVRLQIVTPIAARHRRCRRSGQTHTTMAPEAGTPLEACRRGPPLSPYARSLRRTASTPALRSCSCSLGTEGTSPRARREARHDRKRARTHDSDTRTSAWDLHSQPERRRLLFDSSTRVATPSYGSGGAASTAESGVRWRSPK